MQHTQNIVQSLLVTLAVVVVGTTTVGCTKDHCENDTHCRPGERCDTATNECYSSDVDAGDAQPDGGDGDAGPISCSDHDACTTPEAPVCLPSGFCGLCTDSASDCPADAPICVDGDCVPCTDASTQCANDYSNLPQCVGGLCVACTPTTGECEGTSPICDPNTYTCRACVEHNECDFGDPGSGVCDWDGTGCVPTADRLYVDNANCDSTFNGGGPSDAFCEVSEALPHVNPSMNTIFMVHSATAYLPFNVTTNDIVRIVSRTDAVVAALSPRIIYATGATTELTIDGLVIRDAGSGNIGVECSATMVTLLNNTIHNNGGYGVDADNCTLNIIGNEIHNNTGVGVHTVGGTVTMEANRFYSNDDGGIHLDGSNFSVTNNLIYANGTGGGPGTEWGGVRLEGTALTTHLFHSNTVVDNSSVSGGVAGVRCDNAFDILNSIVDSTVGADVSGICTAYNSYIGDGSGGGTANDNIDHIAFDEPGFQIGSYELASDSPCVNAGDPTGAPALDFAGQTRDASPDIGAYEYVNP